MNKDFESQYNTTKRQEEEFSLIVQKIIDFIYLVSFLWHGSQIRAAVYFCL